MTLMATVPNTPYATTDTAVNSGVAVVCEYCAQPIRHVPDPRIPSYVHSGSGRASCAGAGMPIAEPSHSEEGSTS